MARGIALIIAIVLLGTLTGVAYAALPSAPTLNVREAYYFQNVSQSGDALVLYRASLPEVNWSTYTADGAIVRFTETTVHAQDAPPDIGEFIGGLYLAPGHSVTYGATATVDLLSNPSLFSTNTSSSIGVTYVATSALIATNSADQDIMCATLASMLQNVEGDDSSLSDGDLYTGLNFTEAGTTMVTNAFPIAALVLPSCLVVGLESGTAVSPADPGLETATSASVEATAQWARFAAWAADWGFSDPAVFAALLGLAVTGLVFIVVSVFSSSFMYGSVASSYTLLWAGMATPQYLLKIAFVAAALMSIGAGAFWFGKTPR